MAGISSLGLGSGLDIEGLITKLVTAERQPVENRLNASEARLQTRLTAYGTLKGALSSFQSSVGALKNAASFQSLKASSSDTTVLNASATAIAKAGTYSVEVKQLAQAHKITSKAFTNVTDVVGTGTLTIQFGTYSGGVFTANADRSAQTITIGSSNNTLSGIRDAINAANAGVTATIMNDGTGNKLVLTSNYTGAANSLKVTVSGDADGNNVNNAGLSQLAYDPAGTLGNGKNMTETVVAQDANLTVDGVTNIMKPSNTVTDVIQGVTLNLAKQSPLNTPLTLTVSVDKNSIQAAAQDFVKAYNDLGKIIKDLTAYDPKSKKASALTGDSAVLSITSQMRRVLNSALSGLTGAYTSFSQVGISYDGDGNMKLDSTKLNNAITANSNDVAALFANLGKTTDSLVSYVSATDKTKPGNYAVNITQLAAQGVLNGAGTAAMADNTTQGTFDTPFTINAANDTFAIKVDGIQSGTITLSQGSYTTASALVAEIQSKINGDTALVNSSVKVAVTFDTASDRLVITSNKFGSASTVEITGVDTNTASTLGLSVGAGTAGADVAGTIKGQAALGSGRYLTGTASSDVEGLKLEILGGGTGDRGTVAYTQGYAYQLDALVGHFLESKGPLDARTAGIDNSVKDINHQRELLARRMSDVEKRYRTQFIALDGLLSKMQSTSSFLSQQLSAISTGK